jgi:hypothetical protein
VKGTFKLAVRRDALVKSLRFSFRVADRTAETAADA